MDSEVKYKLALKSPKDSKKKKTKHTMNLSQPFKDKNLNKTKGFVDPISETDEEILSKDKGNINKA